MRKFHLKRGMDYCPEVNIDRLWSMIPEDVYEKAKAGSAEGVPVIDVTKLGYFKVLGKGVLPSIPLVVKARYFSKEVCNPALLVSCGVSSFSISLQAEKKIKASGGACLLTA